MKKLIYLMLLSVLLTACGHRAHITDMQCEHLTSPLGIDAAKPRFSWKFETEEKDFKQEAFQLRIASSIQLLKKNKPDIWSSDKKEASVSRCVYAGKKAFESHKTYYWDIIAWDNEQNKYKSKVDSFEMAKLLKTDWLAKWITDQHDQDFEPAPLFRKSFGIKKDIRSARAYISGLGYYQLFINGQRIGENHLDPGYTHYDKSMLYVTHDITPYLSQNENAIGVVLGNGFYNCQSKAAWDFDKARWRNRPRLLCELRITYTDGTVETIKSDNTWKTATGAYTYNNIYSGDQYDGRLEESGWNQTGFNDKNWEYARIIDDPSGKLVAQQMPAIRIVREITPVSVQSYGDNIHVYDMGENFSGLCRFRITGSAGTTFTLRHGEMLKPNGRVETGNIDIYFFPEKTGETIQTDVFTLKGTGKEEVFEPQFSYHGFRYVEIESSQPIKLTTENLTGLFMHTDLTQTGKFKCSDSLLNKIWHATNQSYRSNLHSIPTDCPQREKNGWTADAHVAIDLALLNFDGINLYEKWMNDFIDNQREDGAISGIIPSSSWGYGSWPGPVWDAALFIIPNALYNYYGDSRTIERLYPTMQKYLDYLFPQEKDGMLHFGLGDWVYYKSQTPNDYTSTVYYYSDYKLMAKFASLLGKDATAYYKKAAALKTIINERYFNAETGIYANGTQTALALALYMDIVPKEYVQKVAENLHKKVAGNDFFLDFGLIGSKTVLHMLAKYGYIEDAYKMAVKIDAPSWGYWVDTQGYSTLAETWTLSPQFRDASLNHVFMGDISAWMYNVLAGINYDEQNPGFQHIMIKPQFANELKWVEAEYNSTRGLIRSSWERKGDSIILQVTIPPGATATIYADKEYQVGSGTYKYVINNNKS
ncbi:MAG: family 78 glycoside hydrolase catalytic domain [Paludibacter sp.]|nr:family 78 glycoside hydrolase catalytic domain [Paludibacter sp.]